MNPSTLLKAGTRRLVDADHSGPSFNFEAKCYPDANDRVIQWLEAQAKEAEADGPSRVELNKDGTTAMLEYQWGDTQISLTPASDGFVIVANGDGQEVDLPKLDMVKEGKYTDDQSEVFVVFNGEMHYLDELFNAFKQLQKNKSIRPNASNAPPP